MKRKDNVKRMKMLMEDMRKREKKVSKKKVSKKKVEEMKMEEKKAEDVMRVIVEAD
jgi:hypothetical protein